MEHLRGFHMEPIEKRTPGNKKKPDEKKATLSVRLNRRAKLVASRNAGHEQSSPRNAHNIVKQEQLCHKQRPDCPVVDGVVEASDVNHEFHQDNKRVKITSESNTHDQWVTSSYYMRDQEHYQGQTMQPTQIKQLPLPALPAQAKSEASTPSPVYAVQPVSESQIYDTSSVSATYDVLRHRQMTGYLGGSANGYSYPPR